MLDLKVNFAVVSENDPDIAAVVGVDDPGQRVDEVLVSQTGPRGDAAIAIVWDRNCLRQHAQTRRRQPTAVCGNWFTAGEEPGEGSSARMV